MKNISTVVKKILLSLSVSLMLPVAAGAQGINGSWLGTLDVGGAKLRIVFHVNADKTVTMDSPDQGVTDIPTNVYCLTEDSIVVELPALNAKYSGKFGNEEIRGTFSQMGYSFPLNLKKGEVKLNRPQTPQPPFPYTTKEVSFDNNGVDPLTGKQSDAGGARLAGTLTLPENFKKGMPVVLMVTGSGQQNRDEELMNHKPFLVIADWLARHGIATLRYDDRGVGKSTGDAAKATTYDNMLDAFAGVDFLKRTKEFGKIGILGHSEGGTIGYMLAAKGKADFVVSLAGPVFCGDSVLLKQNRDILLAQGIPAEFVEKYVTAIGRIISASQSQKRSRFMTPEVEVNMLTQDLGLFEPQKKGLVVLAVQLREPWFAYFVSHDPSTDVSLVKCPVMIIGGEKDLQVNTPTNISLAMKLLKPHGNAANQYKSYPSLNHLFQPCTTGSPMEYGKIETTISEEVLRDITDWINKVTK